MALAAVASAWSCHVDEPNTDTDARTFIRLLVPQNARSERQPLPVRVEVQLDTTSLDGAVPSLACVKVTSRPGDIIFPFAASCGVDARPSDAAVVSDAGADALARADVSSGDGAAISDSGSKTEGVAATCLFLDPQTDKRATGATIALYTPQDGEDSVTLLGAFYATQDCSGPPLATIGLVISVAPVVPDAAAEAASDANIDALADAGTDGEAGVPLDASSDVGPDAGTADAPTDALDDSDAPDVGGGG